MVRPSSKVIIKVLQVMQKHGYIGDLEVIDDHRTCKVVIDLIGRINKCGVISPRFDVTKTKIEQMASDILPSRQFGHLARTTPYSITVHEDGCGDPGWMWPWQCLDLWAETPRSRGLPRVCMGRQFGQFAVCAVCGNL